MSHVTIRVKWQKKKGKKANEPFVMNEPEIMVINANKCVCYLYALNLFCVDTDTHAHIQMTTTR